MDPLSVCASILGIVTAAETCTQGLRQIKQCWKAPQAIDDLILEIEDLKSTLREVAVFVKTAETSVYSDSLSKPVDRACSVIETIHNLISSSPSHLKFMTSKNRSRLIWLRRMKEIKGLLEALKLIRLDLLLKFGVVTISSTAQIQESVDLSISIQHEISQQMSIIINTQANVCNIPQRPMPESERVISKDKESPYFTKPMTSHVLDEGMSDERKTNSAYENVPSSAHQISQESDLQVPKHCAPWCSCMCHTRSKFRSPWVLETLIGRLDVLFTGMRPECNELNCRRTSTASFIAIHRFPAYLISRYIKLTMHYTPVDGLTFALRAPRVTSWSHRYWNYANAGDLPAIQAMFSQEKASPHDLTLHGSNVLMYAANHSDYKISEFLIKQGADPTLPNDAGQLASELLWERSFAGQFGDEGVCIVGSMLEDTDSIETHGFTTLHKIVLKIGPGDLRSDLEISSALINKGDMRGRTPLIWAVIRDDFQAVQTLLAFKADPDKADDQGEVPLRFAISSEICKALLDAGADITQRNSYYQRTCLHDKGRAYGCPEIIDLLIEAGVPTDARDMDNETPLLRAIFWRQTAAAKRFIDYGADVNIANFSSRNNAIHLAVSFNHYQIIPLLLAKGADYTAVDTTGQNIAHLAAMSASPRTLEILRQAKLPGLNISLRDKNGDTPAEIMARREIFGTDEVGVHAVFEAFMKSVVTGNS